MPLTARDIMTTEPVEVSPDTPASDLAEIMVEHETVAVAVVDEQKRFMGLVTERDLLDRNKQLHIPTLITIFDAVIPLEGVRRFDADLKKLTATNAGDLANPEMPCVNPDAPFDTVATVISERGVDVLPVVQGERLLGIIDQQDILRAIIAIRRGYSKPPQAKKGRS